MFDCKPETTEEYEYLRPRSVLYEFTKHERTEKNENTDSSNEQHVYTSLTSSRGCDIPDYSFPPPPSSTHTVDIPPPIPPKLKPMKTSLSESELHSNNGMPGNSSRPMVGSHFNWETRLFRSPKEGSHEQFNSLVPPPPRERSHPSLISNTGSPSTRRNGLDSKSLEMISALQSNYVSSDGRYVQRTWPHSHPTPAHTGRDYIASRIEVAARTKPEYIFSMELKLYRGTNYSIFDIHLVPAKNLGVCNTKKECNSHIQSNSLNPDDIIIWNLF